MSYYIIISLCVIILISYIFEITGKISKIPAVLLLLLTGLTLKHVAIKLNLHIPDLYVLLPIMGTLGLILIVLEGSLDLNIRKENKHLILFSSSSAILLFSVFILLFASIINLFFGYDFKNALINAIPFGIISSAVAIPSSQNLEKKQKEFIIYESSISDILGILVFDFLLFNQRSIANGILFFFIEIVVTIILSVIISAGLTFLLHKIGHHIKYVLILTLVVLVYTIAKLVHWPSLIVVLIFGLILNNNHLFQIKPIKKHINFHELNLNLKAFKQITGELTFIVRSFFFLIFGFYTSVEDLLNMNNLFMSLAICSAIFLLRAAFIKFVLHKPLKPLLFFAPRGLITILLFLSIPASVKLPYMTEGLISQTIFITILIMSFGNIINTKTDKTHPETNKIGDE
jgi:Kef-type K+ transport system membrane component KefB